MEACARVTNATRAIRNAAGWGDAGTAGAADSTTFGAWDRNLMTEWHARYGGRGVMLYWHVERRATCVYSQLKRCSSSEVASMIEGVLRHCTDRSEEHTSELPSLMRSSYAVFCLKQNKNTSRKCHHVPVLQPHH